MNTLRGSGRRRILWICCAMACGCTRVVEPPLDPQAVPLQPPPVYSRWWTTTEACSRLSGSLRDVTWYVVPGAVTVALNGELVTGYYTAANKTIVLAGRSVLDGATVRHEMLHALRRRAGHSRADFLEHCGGVVRCEPKCVKDAGPPPPVNPLIARAGPSALQLSVSLVPEHPTATVDEGMFTVIVTAKNPRTDSVLIDFPPNLQGFFYVLTNRFGRAGSAVPITDAGVTRFAPGETKQQLFDFMILGSYNGFTVRPESYTLTGGYAQQSVSRTAVVIGP